MSRLARLLVPAAILLALVLAAPAGADSVQVGSAGWKWGSPLPQGNTVRSLAFTGASGYAVGDFGTVLAIGRQRRDVARPGLGHAGEPRARCRRSTELAVRGRRLRRPALG